MAQGVLDQLDGWRDYLQAPDARRNVEEIRERRKRERRRNQNQNQNGNENNENENENSESPESE